MMHSALEADRSANSPNRGGLRLDTAVNAIGEIYGGRGSQPNAKADNAAGKDFNKEMKQKIDYAGEKASVAIGEKLMPGSGPLIKHAAKDRGKPKLFGPNI